MLSLQIKKQTKNPNHCLTPRQGRGGDGLRRRSLFGSRFNPARHGSPGLSGHMEIGTTATRNNPFPPKSAAPVLTYRACEWERGPGAPRIAAGRKAEPQLRRSRHRGSESPDKARDGEAERRLMASAALRPPRSARPPASAQRGAAPSASPSEPPRRRRLPGHHGLSWPLRLLRAAQPHPSPPTALGAARK